MPDGERSFKRLMAVLLTLRAYYHPVHLKRIIDVTMDLRSHCSAWPACVTVVCRSKRSEYSVLSERSECHLLLR